MEMPELWLEVTKPYWFLLLLLVFVGLTAVGGRSYIRKAFSSVEGRRVMSRVRSHLPSFFALLALVALVLALADITRSYTLKTETFGVNRILIAVDNSGSMFMDGTIKQPSEREKELFCTSRNLFERYPRISSVCRALTHTVDVVESFSNEHKGRTLDKIGILRFATFSFGQVYPTSDYKRLRQVINEINWANTVSLAGSTNIDGAMWDLYLMALDRNTEPDTKLTYLSPRNISDIRAAIQNKGGGASIYVPSSLREVLESLKRELRDTAFIFITDADLGDSVDTYPLSMRKMLQLATILEVPVYMISVEKFSEPYKRLAQETGYGTLDEGSRGAFLRFSPNEGSDKIAALMEGILNNRLSRTEVIEKIQRESYAPFFAAAALIFLLLYVFSKETIKSSLTDV